jgi:hypothetical protein
MMNAFQVEVEPDMELEAVDDDVDDDVTEVEDDDDRDEDYVAKEEPELTKKRKGENSKLKHTEVGSFGKFVIIIRVCQEKYIQELSVTPVGYFVGATPVGCPTGTILHGENDVFQSNRNDFPKVTFTFEGMGE